MILLMLLLACASPSDCGSGTVYSPVFHQCVLAPEATSEPPPTQTTATTADTGEQTTQEHTSTGSTASTAHTGQL